VNYWFVQRTNTVRERYG